MRPSNSALTPDTSLVIVSTVRRRSRGAASAKGQVRITCEGDTELREAGHNNTGGRRALAHDPRQDRR